MMTMMTEQLLLLSTDKHAHYQNMHKHTARVMVHLEYYLLICIYRILHCKQSVSFYELTECPYKHRGGEGACRFI